MTLTELSISRGDDAIEGLRPGVLVFHEFWGLDDYARRRVDELAKLGYVAFAADLYGGGKLVDHPKDAGVMAGQIRSNVDDWRKRGLEALEVPNLNRNATRRNSQRSNTAWEARPFSSSLFPERISKPP